MTSTLPAPTTQAPSAAASPLKYIDVGINLTDPVYRGVYHGKRAHQDDFLSMLSRAREAGCAKLMITGSSLSESQSAIALAKSQPGLCYATVGVHPCSSKQFGSHKAGPDAMLEELEALAKQGKEEGVVVAFGEIGLDYDRLMLAPKETQLEIFEKQLKVAVRMGLPLFLHSRAASEDFERLLGEVLESLPQRGLVHSFTGSLEEMQRLVAMGFDIGINGCSMKTEENIKVVKDVPLERLQIETDGPWCEMRPSHASAKYLYSGPPPLKSVKKEKYTKDMMVKGRNEPATIPRVAHAIAKIKGISIEEVATAAYQNSAKMFGLGIDQFEAKE
ncbi:MAG: hypothetical protein M1814_005049 [Vezdaea aestivalis]|nr:MAG: hypothetical protein M1814_005049 [Vezdaea aestivalis]